MKLTEQMVKGLKAKEKSYKAFDGGGLYIFVTPRGTKFWRVKYRFEGKEKTYSIGEFPFVGLKTARIEFYKVLEILKRGEDPSAVTTIPKQEINTFKSVCDEWLSKRENIWVKGHTEKQLCRIRKHIYPAIGNKAIDKITPPNILIFLRKLEEDNKIETAHRLLSICSQVFRYAVSSSLCETDPCRDLKGALATAKVIPRAAIIEPKSIAILMTKISTYPTKLLKNALYFSAYTFCRPNEIRRAEWSEINFEKEEWTIPAEKMKMRKSHRVPLSKQCIEILKEMHEMREMRRVDAKWVFPSPRKGRCLSEAAVLTAIRKIGYSKSEMCAHGFRAMASTILNGELNFRPDLVEKALAHGDKDKIRAAYNRAEYFEERRNMMQTYADYLDDLASSILSPMASNF